jgi:metal-responsive CopG/Arc/MetJ family transcriptional regulator
VFDLFDDDKGGTMDFQELNRMLQTIHGEGYANNKGLMDVIEEMKMAVMSLTAVEFTKWNQNHPVLTGPILILQLKFQTDLYGKGFWKNLHDRRYNNPEMIPMSFVSDLADELESFYKEEERKTRSARRIEKIKAAVGGRVSSYNSKDEKSKRRDSMIMGKMNLKHDQSRQRSEGEVKMNTGKLKKELNADIDSIVQPKNSSLVAVNSGAGSPKKASSNKVAATGKGSSSKKLTK